MALSDLFNGSVSVTNTEYFLAAGSTTQGAGQSTKAAIQLWLDLVNLVNGDEFRLRAYDAVASGGTARIAMEWTIAHAQSEPIYITPTLMMFYKWDFSLTRLSSTSRTILWSIRAVS